MPKRSGALYQIALTVAATVLVLAFFAFFYVKSSKRLLVVPEKDEVAAVKNFERRKADIWFAAPDGFRLKPETRELIFSRDPLSFGRAIVRALMDGPGDPDRRTLPETASLNAFYIAGNTAYVDMTVKDFPGGAWLETLAIYSVVNSLTSNMKGVDYVRILHDGNERLTFAGHIDITRPFKADLKLVE